MSSNTKLLLAQSCFINQLPKLQHRRCQHAGGAKHRAKLPCSTAGTATRAASVADSTAQDACTARPEQRHAPRTHCCALIQSPWPRSSTASTPATPSMAQRQWMTSLSWKRLRTSAGAARPANGPAGVGDATLGGMQQACHLLDAGSQDSHNEGYHLVGRSADRAEHVAKG